MPGPGVFDHTLRVAIFAVLAAMLEFRSLIQAKITEPVEEEIFVRSGDRLLLVCEEGDTLQLSATGERPIDQPPLMWTRKRANDSTFTVVASQSSGFYTTAEVLKGKEVRTLLSDAVFLLDSATYRCQNNATPSDTVTVNVVDIITRNATIEKTNVEAKLECMARDQFSVKFNVSWFRNNRRIENMTNKYSTELENGTLTVHKTGEKDIGLYTCVVSLPNGKTLTRDANIFAYPFVKSFEKSQNLPEGSQLTLRCNVWGWPIPEISWYRDDLVLNVSSDRFSFANDTVIPHAHLVLRSVNFQDRAWYTCSATHDRWPGFVSNSTILVRIKGRLAALWPFIGICVEILILSIIIFIYEKQRMKKKEQEETNCDGSKHLANCTTSGHQDNVRHRK